MKPTLVLQAYGSASLRHQARFAVHSWLHWLEPSAFRVLLFTDAPEEFAATLPADLDWATEPMDARRLADWRGGIDFVHRVKIEALRCAAARCGGPLLYLDGDTACVAHPQPVLDALAAGHPVMHTFEGRLATSPHRLHRKIWRKLRSLGEFQVDLTQGERVLTADTPMWNAGVIGLAPAHLPLLDDALVLTDMLYIMYPKHVMEQLAFSFLLDGEDPSKPPTVRSCITGRTKPPGTTASPACTRPTPTTHPRATWWQICWRIRRASCLPLVGGGGPFNPGLTSGFRNNP